MAHFLVADRKVGSFAEPADEMAQSCEFSRELLHAFDVDWFLHFGECLHFFWVGFDSSGGHLMSTHASILVDYVEPPSAEVCRTAAISLKWMT